MRNVHNCHLKLEHLKNVEQYQTKYSFELKLFLSHVDLENMELEFLNWNIIMQTFKLLFLSEILRTLFERNFVINSCWVVSKEYARRMLLTLINTLLLATNVVKIPCSR